jgi:predicted negative regulator of RcsB-dependent stress response
MTEVGSGKWIEVVLLAAAGGLFVWWQFRDLRQAKEASRAQRAARETADGAGARDEQDPPQ